jgi:RNA polymerase sigma factor (sigma-70 family)
VSHSTDDALKDAIRALAVDRHDEWAWQRLYRALWPFCVAVCSRHTGGDTDLAEDAAQDAIGKLVRYCDFGRFAKQDIGRFRAYVTTVATNAVRTRQGAPQERAAVVELIEELLPDVAAPEQQVAADLLEESVLNRLDPEDRQLLRYILEGYALGEIAKLSGEQYSTVGVRLHRIRAVIRKWLPESELR